MPKLLRKYCKRSQGVPDVDKRQGAVSLCYTRLADRPQQVRPVIAYLILCLWLLIPAGRLFAESSPAEVVPAREVKQKGQPLSRWKELWDEAREFARTGDYEGAAARYEKLLAEKNTLEAAQWELAQIRRRLQQWDKAAVLLELLIEAEPERIDYLNALAGIMEEKGQDDRARALYRKAFAKDPDNIEALAGLARHLLKSGDKQDALPLQEKLYRERPDDTQVHRTLAGLLYELGDYEKARGHLTELADQKAADPELLLMTARVHEKLGLQNLAKDYWLRLLEKVPNDQEAQGRLAAYYEKEGRYKDALPYILALLAGQPRDASLLRRAGLACLHLDQFDRAVYYLEKYSALRPDDADALLSLLKAYDAQGNRDGSLAALERYISVEAHPGLDELKRAARLYDGAGRLENAIPLYKRILTVTPDDQEVIAFLSRDLETAGEDEEALLLLKRLTALAPGREDAWRAMIGILERLDRGTELLEALQRFHDLHPGDDRTTLKLAVFYLKAGDYAGSAGYFDKLARKGCRTAEFFAARGLLYEKLSRPDHALQDFEAALDLDPDNLENRLHAIRLAGVSGRLATVRKHIAEAGRDREFIRGAAFKLAAADALRECGDYAAALKTYDGIKAPDTFLQKVLLGKAELFAGDERIYEAQQALRLALNVQGDHGQVLARLFDLSLLAGDSEDAGVWLNRASLAPDMPACEIGLMRARFLASRGELRPAVKICRRLLSDKPWRTGPQPPASIICGAREVKIALIRFLTAAGRLKEAEDVCLELIEQYGPSIDTSVLLGRIYGLGGDKKREGQRFSEAITIAGRDLGELSRLAVLARGYKEYGLMTRAAELALKKAPDSVKAGFLLSEARESAGRVMDALSPVREILAEYPDNLQAAARLARLLFRSGVYEEALQQCNFILSRDAGRPDIIMMLARIRWARHEWSAAMAGYKAYLTPAVDEIIARTAKERGVDLTPPVQERSFFDFITSSDSGEQGPVDQMMSAAYAADNDSVDKRARNEITAPLYATYRWQKKFSRELAARRSIRRREYYQAVKQYEAMLRDYPDDDVLMFDLAGIYSRQGRLGEEAVIYERMASVNRDFPGLADAEQRNRLKRRPRLSFGYGFKQEEGRHDYKDINKQWLGADIWFSPRPRQEVDVSASRIRYRSVDGERDVYSKRADLAYRAEIFSGHSLSMGGGIEAQEDGYADTALLNCSLSSKFGDKLKTRLAYTRDVIADTIASLARNVVSQDMEAGISLDLFPRLILGGDYGLTDFSDGNQLREYTLRSSYIVFPEPFFLKFGYTYNFMDSREGPQPGAAMEDGFGPEDHPYWSPENYWLNKFSLFFKHQFSRDPLDRGTPRYYTAEYSFGYDAQGYMNQSLKCGFFMEWTPHFILRASAEATSSKVYRSRGIMFSAAYRW